MGRRHRKNRCGFPGCQVSVQGTGNRCIAHTEGRSWQGRGAPPGNQNARKHGLYSSYVPVVALEQALDLPPGDLRLEIAVTRALLAELLKMNLPADQAVPVFDRASGTLARLLRTNKVLEAVGSNGMQDLIGRVVGDLDREDGR